VYLYDGAEGTPAGELVDTTIKGGVAHAGGIYVLSWTRDGKKLLTASGDKTCKLWDVEAKTLLRFVVFLLFLCHNYISFMFTVHSHLAMQLMINNWDVCVLAMQC
jgi:WD40 repeat protein